MLLEEFIDKQKRLLELEKSEEVIKSKLLIECSPKVLEEKNLCIRKLTIINIFTGLYGRTIVEFEAKQHKEESSKRVFSQGDIIGIYLDSSKSDTTKTLATGLFYKANKDSIQIALDNNLDNDDEVMKDIDGNLFRLMKLSSEITYSRLKSGLKYLEKRSNPLCGDYLIDVLLGTSSLATPNIQKDLKFINERLNDSQKEAVQFALSRSDVAIIHGPPGTGKTTVAVEIINQILECHSGHKKPKILVCTPSNIALDNLAEKLLKSNYNKREIKSKSTFKLNLLRLGHSARVMPHLSDISLDYKLSNCDQAELIAQVRAQIDSTLKHSLKKHDKIRPERRGELSNLRKELRDRELKAIREVLGLSHVVMSTLTGLRSNKSLPLNEIEFDVVLIDEASQAIEAACWLAIPRGKKLILAGDHKQLPPTVLSEQALKEGLGQSLMERLLDLYPDKQITRMLSCQYRMHEDIMRWSSDTFYQSELVADLSVAKHCLQDIFLDNKEEIEPLGALTFIDTAGCDLFELASAQEDSKANQGEAQLAAVYINEIVDRFQLKPEHIGVITPYSRQVQLIKEAIKNRMIGDNQFDCSEIEISTVDGFQGREKEVIVTTLVRSNQTGTIGFLSEHRRLNVALTRAKRHLCIIGDSSTIEQSGDKILTSLINYWNTTAEVRSAHEYVYEHDISSGDCVKTKKASKVVDNKKNIKSKNDENIKLENMVCQQLKNFKLNNKENQLEFPSSLNPKLRAILHELAESLQLYHESIGEGVNRRLIVSKSSAKKTDKEVSQVSEVIGINELPQNNISVINEEIEEKNCVLNEEAKEDISMLLVTPIEENCGKIEQPKEVSLLKDEPKDYDSSTTNLLLHKNCVVLPNNELRKMNNLSEMVELKAAQLAITIEKYRSKKMDEKLLEKKKPNKPKKVKQPTPEIPEDFDEMLSHFQSLDKICQNPEKCSTRVSVLGFNCQFCKKRYCVSHAQAEVHLCPLANRTAWRNLDSAPRPLSNSKQIKHVQLSRAINKKLNTLSDNRKSQKKPNEN